VTVIWSGRTEFAERAVSISESFAKIAGYLPVAGPVTYRAELVAPEGLSTGGGARSLLHLRLLPVTKGAAIVIGSCDQIEMTAVLRTWELLAEQYAQRFKGAKLPVDAVEYGKLLERIEAFFRVHTMRVDRLDVDRAPVPVTRPPEPKAHQIPSVPWIVALVVLGAAIGSSLTLLMR
jgi:hypothetical protein